MRTLILRAAWIIVSVSGLAVLPSAVLAGGSCVDACEQCTSSPCGLAQVIDCGPNGDICNYRCGCTAIQ